MELGCTLLADLNNPELGDLRLGDNGDVVILTELGMEVAQRLTVRMAFFKGEWFLDLDAGTPYYQTLFRKNPPPALIRGVFNRIISDCEGVDAVTSLTFSVGRDRKLSLAFTCRLKDGSTFRSTDYAPYIVPL